MTPQNGIKFEKKMESLFDSFSQERPKPVKKVGFAMRQD